MTREEAKRRLLDIERCTPIHTREDVRDFEALEMAIQALSQEPTDTWSIKDVADTFKKHGIIREQEPCDDAISRPAVIKFEGTNMACMGGDEIMKEFENNTQQNNDKAISLERAKKQISRWIGYIDQDMINRICMSLDALPPVTQKSGKWHIAHGMYEDRFWCSCGYIRIMDSRMNEWKYCPVCGGAKMVEPQERSDKE